MYGSTFFKFVELIKDVEKYLNSYYSGAYNDSHPAEVIINVTVGCDSSGTLGGFYMEVSSGFMFTKTDTYVEGRVFKIRLTDYLFRKQEVIAQISNRERISAANDNFIGQR
jgi:hypothetical protein